MTSGVNIVGGIASDPTGHGTRCSLRILSVAPCAEIVPVRVFDGALDTSAQAVAAALDWSNHQRIRLINLSLGTTEQAGRALLASACERTLDGGAIIVAAAHSGGNCSYPAAFPRVIAVRGTATCDAFDYHVLPGPSTIVFAAALLERGPLGPGTLPSSFAAAGVTGIISLLLEAYPGISREDVIDLLISYQSDSGGLTSHPSRYQPSPAHTTSR